MGPADDRWLGGSRVVITAGGTREPIDPVRFIGNRSSGKMGNELARAAADLGARVTLITAAAPPPPVPHVDVVNVETAEQMNAALQTALPGARVLIMAAAVSDWRPSHVAGHKLKKHSGALTLELVPTVDILAALRQADIRRGVFVVGFAAETENAVTNAQVKLREKGLDLIVVNDVSRAGIGMGSDDNEVTVIDEAGVVEILARAPKPQIAAEILRVVRERMQ